MAASNEILASFLMPFSSSFPRKYATKGSAQFTRGQMAGLLWPVIRQQTPRLTAILALSLLVSLLAAALPWPLKFLVDVALGDQPAPAWMADLLSPGDTKIRFVLLAGLALVALRFCYATIAACLEWLWEAAGQRMVYALSAQLLAALQRKSMAFHLSQTPGELMNRLSVDCWAAYTVTAQLLVSPAKNLLTIATVGLAAYALSPELCLILMGTAPILAFSVWYFGGRIGKLATAKRQADAAMSDLIQNTLSTMPVVRNYALVPRNNVLFAERAMRSLNKTTALAFGQGRYSLLNSLTLAAGISCIIFAGSVLVIKGSLSVGSLLVFVTYIEVLRTAFMELLNAYGQLRTIEASVVRLLEVTEAPVKVTERDYAWPLVLASGQAGPHISFEAVYFSYRADRPILKDVTIDVAPGETLALVGETGSGKSTFCSLLPRFFDPTHGRITIDGQDLCDVTLASLRDQISIVLQEPLLLPLSIADNIAFGRPGASEEDIHRAAWQANAAEFIQDLENGYDTLLGERGSTLSGGQCQRIAIARALLKQAPILLLDEPTSALDPATETKVVSALDKLSRHSTTIIIAHRLSTIRNADRVAVFDKGRIVECGTPDALLEQRGQFWRYHKLQALPSKATMT